MSCWQISVTLSAQYVESLSEHLETCGALAITFEDAQDEPILEPDLGTTPLWSLTRVSALFPDDYDVHLLAHALVEDASWLFISKPEISVIDDKNWEAEYRKSVKPLCFADRFWIIPTWESISDPTMPHLILDPGLAFGTGTHPTTALCLTWLVQHLKGQETIVDYGCGSGILGLAAIKLGAKKVWAVDHDSQALEATLSNAANNQISATHLQVSLPAALPTVQADVVVANILANPLIVLAPRLLTYVKPGGALVLSGILQSQAQEVIAAYQSAMTAFEIITQDEWCLLVARRNTSLNKRHYDC